MNVTLAFVLDLGTETDCKLTMAAASFYKLYVDGRFIAFGPQRAAHGYARKATYTLKAKTIVAEVMSLGVRTYYCAKQLPFFACEVETGDGKHYTAEDFFCCRLTDRLQKVQRYSYQRGFAEVYKMTQDRMRLYRGKLEGEILETVPVSMPRLLSSWVDEPRYELHKPARTVEKGTVTVNQAAAPWRDRAHTQVGINVEGFRIDEWEDRPTDEASAFVYHPDIESVAGGLRYQTVDFGRAITGFTELTVRTSGPAQVYFLFDEILWNEAGKGTNFVSFERNTCSSVHKWTFEQAGEYRVSTFEPYTVRYACIVATDLAQVEIALRDYENPNVGKFVFSCEDPEIQSVIEAAKATLSQNSVDILTDCPSRERAGWLSDSYFSSEAERIMTGKNQAEKTFLENYAHADCSGLPSGMIPMCYPSDIYPETPYVTFIPNWSMWYILELEKYAKSYGVDQIIADSRSNVEGLIDYFLSKENEFGVLEDLDGWVFVEWSTANDEDHTKGVNVPSNIVYSSCLMAAGRLYGRQDWIQKGKRIQKFLRERAFNGAFFVDNLIRNEKGGLEQTELITEVCQYYAFWFELITKKEYPLLYEELMERLGTNRQADYRPEVGTSNVMYGMYMRIDLLMRDGKQEKVLEECMKLLRPMAERTGTLWEHNAIRASCNHGFAAYSIKWIIYGLTGQDVSNKK